MGTKQAPKGVCFVNIVIIMNKLLSFEDVMKMANKPRLLLGNGFSMAYDKDRFSFTSLLESSLKDKIIKKSDFVYKIFEKLNTADFESVMKILDESQKVLEIYKGEKSLIKKIKDDSEQLKSHLVKIITNNHPEISTAVPGKNKEACINFLKPFEKIYTLNYDLLLYWATMHDNSDDFTDGFGEDDYSIHKGYVVYKNKYDMRVHYLHGGLHIFDAGSEIIKKTYSKTGVRLVDQVKENLNKGIYPIFISEGDSNQKLTKILHNSYLNHCYKSLRFIGGDLVILGTELKRNDAHILDAIMESKVQNIFVGVSKAESVEHIKDRVDSYNYKKSEKKKKTIRLYDYKTVDIWGNK